MIDKVIIGGQVEMNVTDKDHDCSTGDGSRGEIMKVSYNGTKLDGVVVLFYRGHCAKCGPKCIFEKDNMKDLTYVKTNRNGANE